MVLYALDWVRSLQEPPEKILDCRQQHRTQVDLGWRLDLHLIFSILGYPYLLFLPMSLDCNIQIHLIYHSSQGRWNKNSKHIWWRIVCVPEEINRPAEASTLQQQSQQHSRQPTGTIEIEAPFESIGPISKTHFVYFMLVLGRYEPISWFSTGNMRYLIITANRSLR